MIKVGKMNEASKTYTKKQMDTMIDDNGGAIEFTDGSAIGTYSGGGSNGGKYIIYKNAKDEKGKEVNASAALDYLNSKADKINESINDSTMSESVNFKGLVNLANKNEDVSKHKDLGKACWQYLFPRIKDMARELDIEDTNIIVKAIYDWIKKHETMNESVGMTQDDWKEVNPSGYDEGQIEGYIRGYDEAAKALKCKAKDLVNITEDDGPAYNKILNRIKDGDKGQKVKMPSIDGQAGLFTLTNGCTVVTTNEWGYGTVYVKKSEVKKAMNESIESDFNSINESAKISKMTKTMGQGYSGVWQLPSGTPGLIAEAGDIELVVLGDEEGVQIILQDEDDIWFKSYTTDKEKQAVAEFKKVAALLTDLVDASKLAKKFGLTTM